MALGAQNVIDQNQPTQNGIYAQFDQANLAQSFRPGVFHPAVMSGAGIFLADRVGSGSATLTINLWTALPNAGGASMIATGSTNFNANNQWVDVFWSPVGVTSGQTYVLEFLSTNNTYGIFGSNLNPYGNGQLFANTGFQTSQTYNCPIVTLICPSDGTANPQYTESFADFDYTFRTYATVPEPATFATMGAGLLALFGIGMRRRRNGAQPTADQA